jgi:hypothetical protein
LLALAALALCLGHAHAQGINEPEVEKGQRKLESVHIIQNGFNGGLAGSTREVHSGAFTQGITDIWQVKGFVAFDRLDHQGYEAVAGVVENTFAILDAKKSGGLGLAWFTGIAVSLLDRETNALVYGPILRLGAGPTSLVLNPFLETTFGQNEEGTALLYAWQLKHEVRKGLFLGAEGYGRYPDITGGEGAERHRIGPFAAFEFDVGEKRTLTLETGLLFGLTEETADTTVRAQVSLTFGGG